MTDPNEVDGLVNQLASAKLRQQFNMKKNQTNVVVDIVGETIDPNTNKKLYTVLWSDDSTTNEPVENISDNTLYTIGIKNQHNKSIQKSFNNGSSQKTALIYTRTSSKNDISIDTQKIYNLSYAKGLNMLVHQYAEDNGVSGRYNEKKKLMSNMDRELGFWTVDVPLTSNNILIVYSVDRLGRHASSILTLLDILAEKGVEIHFVKENIIWNTNIPSSQKIVVQQAALQAQQHSDITSEKVRKTFQRLRNEGHHVGIPKYGYRTYRDTNGIRRLGKNKKELGVLRKTMDLYKEYRVKTNYNLSEGTSFYTKKEIYNGIATELKNANIFTRRNKPFGVKQLENIVNQYLTTPIPDDKEEYPENVNWQQQQSASAAILAPTFQVFPNTTNINTSVSSNPNPTTDVPVHTPQQSTNNSLFSNLSWTSWKPW